MAQVNFKYDFTFYGKWETDGEHKHHEQNVTLKGFIRSLVTNGQKGIGVNMAMPKLCNHKQSGAITGYDAEEIILYAPQINVEKQEYGTLITFTGHGDIHTIQWELYQERGAMTGRIIVRWTHYPSGSYSPYEQFISYPVKMTYKAFSDLFNL